MRASRIGAAIVAVWAVAIGVAKAAPAVVDAGDARVRRAIVAAVESRLGGNAEVTVASVTAAIVNQRDGEILATPDPTARLGGVMRFALAAHDPSGPLVRIGQATAIVTATADYVRTSRQVARGSVVGEADVEHGRGPLGEMMLRRLLTPAEAAGARAPHELASGTMLTEADVVAAPAVKSGDHVRAVVRVGVVEASMTAIAVESGPIGRVIRIVNADSKRTLRARISGNGEVEVMQ